LDGLLHKLKPLIFNPGKITTKEKEYSKALFQRKTGPIFPLHGFLPA
jgi:hypothetical protein